MTAFFDLVGEYFRFWPYLAAVVAGAAMAIIDRRVIGQYLFAVLLIVIAVGGQVTMHVSPFTFSGGDYYMIGLIVSLLALAALAGYGIAVLASLGCRKFCTGRAA